MQDGLSRRITGPQLLVLLLLVTQATLLPAQEALEAKKPQREQIGTALGKPVYRDQLNTESTDKLTHSLQSHFSAVLEEAYFEKHRIRLAPTQQEFDAYTEDDPDLKKFSVTQISLRQAKLRQLERSLKTPDLSDQQRQKLEKVRKTLEDQQQLDLASFVYDLLIYWKMEVEIYQRYGGGRVRSHMFGFEPLDANHRWLKEEEKKGRFKISDPKLRTLFYVYWTDTFSDGFLMQDQEEIRRDFLEPNWLRQALSETPVTAKKP
ncbi:hypothetical protein Pan241w_26690 [Gimesia alba]|uniref:Uncharacterized protein n=1 Tax=Gimesia alba TaxID=2527973 RepID=A0A517RFD1_9PLAN|nr:hypothetical protein [Gimesia alba]QDT42583.1 hypothetical protein Pan241w_26690 [Gimesia alba]